MLNRNVLSPRSSAIFCAISLLTLVLCAPINTSAQATNDYNAERQRAIQLVNDSKFDTAIPILEKLAVENPSDAQVMYGLGIANLLSSRIIKDDEKRRQMRIRARTALLRAKDLGVRDEMLEMMLKSILPDGNEPGVSKNRDANKAMLEAGAAFTNGDLDTAVTAYERAARLDPTLYEAALYAGNTYYAKKKWDKAGEWFAKAIAIDADRETAYRYWGDAFMLQGKQEESRAKFLDAIIAEPDNQLAWKGLIQWAQRNHVGLAHPKIIIPVKVTPGDNDSATTVALSDKINSEDGSASWTLYAVTRAAWVSKKFSQAFPNEKTYRHSLPEEAEALRLVAETAAADLKSKKIKMLEPSLANLVMLNDAGLLEAYILLARPDQGIAQDYAKYRKANRDKLRRYMLEQVVHISPNK